MLNGNINGCQFFTEGSGADTKYYIQSGADTASKKELVNVVFNDIHGELLIDTVNDYHGFSIYKPDGKYFNRIDTSFPTGIPNNTAFMIYNGNVSYTEERRLAYYRTSNTPVNTNHSLDLSSDIQKIFIVIQSKGTSRFDWTYTIAFVDE